MKRYSSTIFYETKNLININIKYNSLDNCTNKLLLCFLGLIYFYSISCKSPPLIIEIKDPENRFTKIDNDTTGVIYYFLVENYKSSNEIPEYLNDFACSHAPNYVETKYDSYSMIFVKKTNKTNEQNFKDDPISVYKNLVVNDRIAFYNWKKSSRLNTWLTYVKFHNLNQYRIKRKSNPCDN